MATALKRYGFINAKLKTKMGALLEDDFFTRIARATNLSEAILLLKDTPYSALEKIYAKTGDLKLAELELYGTEIKLYLEIRRHLDDKLQVFINALLLSYEVQLVKNILRLWFDKNVRKRDIGFAGSYLYRNRIIHNFDIDRIINTSSVSALIEMFASTPYQQIISKNSEHLEEQTNIFPVEMDLDAFYYSSLANAAETLPANDRKIIRRVTGVEIDLENITRIIRLKNFYNLPAEEIITYTLKGGRNLKKDTMNKASATGQDKEALTILIENSYPGFSGFLDTNSDTQRRMVLIESLLQEIQTREVRKMLVGNPFSIGIIMSYFFLKKNEIKKLVLLLNAKNFDMTEEQLRGKL